MMKQKTYEVTDEIKDLFLEADAARLCRDEAIKSIWGTKRAIRFAKINASRLSEAWALVYALYPELLEGYRLTFFSSDKTVVATPLEKKSLAAQLAENNMWK